MLAAILRVMASFGLPTFRLRSSACHSSGILLAVGGVKYAFPTQRLLALCTVLSAVFCSCHPLSGFVTRSQAVARIADRTASQ